MMIDILNCVARSLPVLAIGFLTYGTLALAAAALVKYVFYSPRGGVTG